VIGLRAEHCIEGVGSHAHDYVCMGMLNQCPIKLDFDIVILPALLLSVIFVRPFGKFCHMDRWLRYHGQRAWKSTTLARCLIVLLDDVSWKGMLEKSVEDGEKGAVTCMRVRGMEGRALDILSVLPNSRDGHSI